MLRRGRKIPLVAIDGRYTRRIEDGVELQEGDPDPKRIGLKWRTGKLLGIAMGMLLTNVVRFFRRGPEYEGILEKKGENNDHNKHLGDEFVAHSAPRERQIRKPDEDNGSKLDFDALNLLMGEQAEKLEQPGNSNDYTDNGTTHVDRNTSGAARSQASGRGRDRGEEKREKDGGHQSSGSRGSRGGRGRGMHVPLRRAN